MHVGVVAIGNFPAVLTLVAAIRRHASGAAHWLLAVQSFRQRLGNRFELTQIVSGKKICMCQAPAFERALQQMDALFLVRKIFKCHAAKS